MTLARRDAGARRHHLVRERAVAEPDASPRARGRRHPARAVRAASSGASPSSAAAWCRSSLLGRRRRLRADRRRSARVLALAGSVAWEYIWVEAGQSVPLSWRLTEGWKAGRLEGQGEGWKCAANQVAMQSACIPAFRLPPCLHVREVPIASRSVRMGRLRRLRVDQLAEEGPAALLDHSDHLLQLRVGVRHPRLRRQGEDERPQDRRQPAASRQPRPHVREGRRHAEPARRSGSHPLSAAA